MKTSLVLLVSEYISVGVTAVIILLYLVIGQVTSEN